jgi:probable rRNA maturation factor
MDVAIVDRQRAHRVPTGALAAYMRRLARRAPATERDGVVVMLCGDAAMRRLNARFRGKDTTTDVLSFPAGDGPHPEGGSPLGEIAISVPQAARQARAAGHTLGHEIRLLALHGYLHLLGYDHEVDDGSMLRLQARLARRLAARWR